MAEHFPKIHDELLAIFARLERHYRDMCDTEFTIEQGKLWMLQTRVGKRTGAAALRMAVDMTKGTGKGAASVEDQPRGGAHRGSPPTTSTRCCTRSSPGRARCIAKGLAASPGAAVGKVYFTADDAEAAAEPGREGHPRAQRDEPRGRPRDDGRRGHPHRPRRPRQPRRRRRPRLGHAGGRRRRGGQDLRQVSSPPAASPSTRATSSRSTARPARSCSARWSSPPPSRRPSSTRSSKWADARPQGQARRAGQRRHRRGRRQRPPPRRRGHRAVPHRAHVPRPRPPAGRAPDDPRQHRRGGGRGARRAAQGPAGRLHRDPRGDGRPAGHGAPARPAAARVPPVGRGAAHQGGHRAASTSEEKRAARRGRELVRAQPDDRHPRRAPRRRQAGPLRDAGAGAARRRRRPAQEGQEPDRRDHDPAHRHPRGAGPRPRLGRGGDRRGDQGPEEEAGRSRSAR